MLLEQRLGKCLAFFAGGYGFAKLDADGEFWKFTVTRPAFNSDERMVLMTGEYHMHAAVVREQGKNGLVAGFSKALDDMREGRDD